MANNVIQTSFNSGEWAPALNARVDLAKYKSGAATLRNFFVDYRGGASTRPGSRFVLPTKTTNTTRLVRFQASFTVSYMLEFGAGYIRFYNNGSPIVEAGNNITSAGGGPPTVFTDAAHGYSNGDWLIIQSATYIVAGATTNTFTLTDLFGNPINTNPFTLPALAQRVYTISNFYVANELFQIKFSQNVNTLICTHPNHPPAQLVLTTATNWTFSAITFGATIPAPSTINIVSNLPGGNYYTAYCVTAVDANGQESAPSVTGFLNAVAATSTGTNTITWPVVTGAITYNVYRTIWSFGGVVPSGAAFGFMGSTSGTTFIDTTPSSPNFSQGPPVIQNPFAGSGIASINLSANGAYTVCPNVVISTPNPGGIQATAQAFMSEVSITLSNAGTGYAAGDTITLLYGIVVKITSVTSPAHGVNSFFVVNPGLFTSTGGTVPANPMTAVSTSGSGVNASFNVVWGVSQVNLINPGTNYSGSPTVGFTSPGGSGAVATASLGAPSAGNPTVAGFHQQRLVLAGPVGNPQQMNLSVPGAYYNYNITLPAEPDNAIQATLVSGQLNTIQAMVSFPSGLLVLGDKQAWLVNGGSFGSPATAFDFVANPQSYNGMNQIPPIVADYDILFVQAKGSIVRDLTYDFYKNIFTGTDISIISSHLFYGFTMIDWAWAEEPFKLVWITRNDGQLLSLTYSKAQEMVAWSRHDTQGAYKSVASVTETVAFGNVDAVYTIVQRTINGVTVQYIERFVELNWPQGYISSQQVDAGIGYSGSPATTFTGANHLAGAVVTGVADGTVINFTMPVSGTFVFGPGGTTGLTGIPSASVVYVGLAFTPQLQTLALDVGEPTAQGKRKTINGFSARVTKTLGLSAGRTFATLVPMQDLIIGNVNEPGNFPVTDLVTGDARTILDPQWDVFGQCCLQQSLPYPASVLGVIPEIVIGDN